jgi:hypothetical protein
MQGHLTKKRLEISMALTYTEDENGIYYPDLLPPQTTAANIGRWGRKRQHYLKEYRPAIYTIMKTEGTLFDHLADIDRQVEQRLFEMVPRMAKAQGINEEMKAQNQMGWVGAMNNIRHSAEEIINSELIYS